MAHNIPLRDRYPILVNSVLIACALCASVFIAMLFFDVFTSHGQEKLVPEVRNMPLNQAIAKLEEAGLNWEIADSTNWNENFKPGMVMDQEPRAGSFIKAIRTVYLSVNASHPRIVSFPKFIDTPLRQTLATLRTMGFKSIEIDTVESVYRGLVVNILVNGRPVAPGTGVTINAIVRISVGDGSIEDSNPFQAIDSATIDSIENAQALELGL